MSLGERTRTCSKRKRKGKEFERKRKTKEQGSGIKGNQLKITIILINLGQRKG